MLGTSRAAWIVLKSQPAAHTVSVAGRGVAVGGSGVSVGGIAVAVGVGGMGVAVGEGGIVGDAVAIAVAVGGAIVDVGDAAGTPQAEKIRASKMVMVTKMGRDLFVIFFSFDRCRAGEWTGKKVGFCRGRSSWLLI